MQVAHRLGEERRRQNAKETEEAIRMFNFVSSLRSSAPQSLPQGLYPASAGLEFRAAPVVESTSSTQLTSSRSPAAGRKSSSRNSFKKICESASLLLLDIQVQAKEKIKSDDDDELQTLHRIRCDVATLLEGFEAAHQVQS